MDDSCAVCAEALEWVAYGACGHKEVCSTCVARLRFICDDRRCCICKTDSSVVFVTKALGDYTRMINDFSLLPSEVKEGRVGPYWYHEDTQAYFDDLDHYKMIKAMCKLSCSLCDKMEEHHNEGLKRRGKFRSIEQLKGHLFHKHRLLMCSLCLEGRKVFICEQKLYTRAQLNQHISTGDSVVDGTESERGGFMGHPTCEFCRTPFYGENELYSHMSTEHYTCHICQRQHPGQYEYYKNYDDLEMHFRRDHFLCEDEACLAKKFVVFQSEAEMKRHNTLEHGGRMSRSKRSAALQIPTSFRFRRSTEQDNRHGRGRIIPRDSSDDPELSVAIQASLETVNLNGRLHDPSPSSAHRVFDQGETDDVDSIIQPIESLAARDSESSSRYLQAVSHNSRNAPLEESSFPPLPLAPTSSQQKPKKDPEGLPKSTMAAHLRRKNNQKITVINSAQAWPAASRGPLPPTSSLVRGWSTTNGGSGSSSSFPVLENGASLSQISDLDFQSKPVDSGPSASSYSSFLQVRPLLVHDPSSGGLLSSSKNLGSTSRISHSSSAPSLVGSVSFDSKSDFPPVSASQIQKSSAVGKANLQVNEVHTANKSLVERIRAALEFDQDKYVAFKDISGEYRQGLIDAETYLAYVQQFGLSHLVIELARLLPDANKQKELIEIFNANLPSKDPLENGWPSGTSTVKGSDGSKKGKGKVADTENSSLKGNLADSIISGVQKSSEGEVEVLSKDGYRTSAKGKSKAVVEPPVELAAPGQPLKLKDQIDSNLVGGGSKQNLEDKNGRGKQRKKTSKFLRVRLGDGSDPDIDPDSDSIEAPSTGQNNTEEGLPVRGVWKKGGGQKLLSMTLKDGRR